MTKETYVRQALEKLQDVRMGASGLLYFLDSQELDVGTLDTLCVLLQEAISPVYDHDVSTEAEIKNTINKLHTLQEHMQKEKEADAILSSYDI